MQKNFGSQHLLIACVLMSPCLVLGCPSDDPKNNGNDTGIDTGDDTTIVIPEHDCVPYTPAVVSDSFSGTLTDASDEPGVPLPIPAEPGGGYLTVNLDVDQGWAGMFVEHSGGGSPSAPPATEPNGNTNHAFAFEVYDGESYTAFVSVTGLLTEDFPVGYTVTWDYVGVHDCYEHNDAVEWIDGAPQGESKSIPVDQTLEAYSLFGYRSDGAFFWVDDWYDFTLDAPTEVAIRLLQTPSDVRSQFRLFDTPGSGLATASATAVGGTYEIDFMMLEAGTYYLHYAPIELGNSTAHTAGGDPLPDHWVTPYQFTIETR